MGNVDSTVVFRHFEGVQIDQYSGLDRRVNKNCSPNQAINTGWMIELELALDNCSQRSELLKLKIEVNICWSKCIKVHR